MIKQTNDQFISSSSDVVSNMTSVETIEQGINRIAILETYSIQDLIKYFYSKKGQSEVKDSIILENEEIRKIAIIGFGRLLLFSWEMSYEDIDIQNILKFSSLAEGRRMKEDYIDFSREIINSFAYSLIGKSTSSNKLQYQNNQFHTPVQENISLLQAYSEVLNDLFHRFDNEIQDIDDKLDIIMGYSNNSSNSDISNTSKMSSMSKSNSHIKNRNIQRSYRALDYLPLVKNVLEIVLGQSSGGG